MPQNGHTMEKPKGGASMEKNWLKGPMPMGLGMALVENPTALEKYAAMSREEKQQFINGSKGSDSKQAMQSYVDQLATN